MGVKTGLKVVTLLGRGSEMGSGSQDCSKLLSSGPFADRAASFLVP